MKNHLMIAQKVSIGPKGAEAQKMYFSYSKQLGASMGDREPLMALTRCITNPHMTDLIIKAQIAASYDQIATRKTVWVTVKVKEK